MIDLSMHHASAWWSAFVLLPSHSYTQKLFDIDCLTLDFARLISPDNLYRLHLAREQA